MKLKLCSRKRFLGLWLVEDSRIWLVEDLVIQLVKDLSEISSDLIGHRFRDLIGWNLKKSKLKSGGYHQLQNAWKNNDSDGRGFGSGYFIKYCHLIGCWYLSSPHLSGRLNWDEILVLRSQRTVFKLNLVVGPRRKQTQTENKTTTKIQLNLILESSSQIHAHTNHKSR